VAGRVALAFDAATLTAIGQVQVPRAVFAAAALDDRLYLATDQGIYVTSPMSETVLGMPQDLTHLPGFAGSVKTISADPSRSRLLALSHDDELLTVEKDAIAWSGGCVPMCRS
jgi:hypothetical protein